MNAITGINGSDAAVRNTPNQFSEMSSEDFIKIIFTELANQDPFDPNDSAALLQQLSSIRSIESDLRLTQQLQALVQENQLASAGNLIGKIVGGLTEENDRVAGYAVAVHREGSKVYIELDKGWLIPASGIETVFDPSLFDGDVDKDVGDPPSDSPGDDSEKDN